MELLPKDLRIITNPVWSALTDRVSGSLKLLKSGHPLLAIGNCIRLAISVIGAKSTAARMIAKMMPAINEEYDTIVDFNGQQQLYYMVDKLKAKKKVTFFHSDYVKWPYYLAADKRYYPKVDHIFTISEQCVKSLKRYFQDQSEKIGMMENISSLDLIERMAADSAQAMDKGVYKLLTIGHVCENKGILWAIEAAKIMKQHGVDFHWYFIGSVDHTDIYARLIKEADVRDRISFLGVKTNPYPFMQKADVIVHPSKFEGRSIALDEAKLLCKPVVVTNFSTVNDQFTDRYNASICQMASESIADAIEELLTDSALQKRYAENLRAERHDNTSEIEKLYAIFDAD